MNDFGLIEWLKAHPGCSIAYGGIRWQLLVPGSRTTAYHVGDTPAEAIKEYESNTQLEDTRKALKKLAESADFIDIQQSGPTLVIRMTLGPH
jgi:hypothetical protein